MMNTIKALELALEALEKATRYGAGGFEDTKEAIKQALNTATPLAAPVQKPVANIPGLAADESAFIRWALKNKYDTSSHPMFFVMLDPQAYAAREGWKAAVAHYELVAPPAAQPAVPLTRERVKEICADAGYGMTSIQARLDFINGIRQGEAAHGITEKGQP